MSGPVRWKDDPSAETEHLAEALQHAADVAPSSAQLKVLTEGVKARLVHPPPPASAGASVAVGVPMVMKALGAAALLGSLAWGGAWFVESSDEETSAQRSEQTAALADQRTAAAEVKVLEAPLDDAQLDDAQVLVSERARDGAERPTLPRRLKQAHRRKESTKATSVGRAEASEVSLLWAARRARNSQPQKAFAALVRHQVLFPEGTLREEREALAIELLTKTGQEEAAQERFAAFVKRYSHSAYLPGLRRVGTQ